MINIPVDLNKYVHKYGNVDGKHLHPVFCKIVDDEHPAATYLQNLPKKDIGNCECAYEEIKGITYVYLNVDDIKYLNFPNLTDEIIHTFDGYMQYINDVEMIDYIRDTALQQGYTYKDSGREISSVVRDHFAGFAQSHVYGLSTKSGKIRIPDVSGYIHVYKSYYVAISINQFGDTMVHDTMHGYTSDTMHNYENILNKFNKDIIFWLN